MKTISKDIVINDKDIRFVFIRASGPGGQNVNKVSTAVQLRFDIKNCISIPEEIKEKILKIARNKINSDGILIIEAKRYRSQGKNKEDALLRLEKLIQKASEKRKVRINTKPTRTSVKKRLETKRKRSDVKKMRGSVRDYEE